MVEYHLYTISLFLLTKKYGAQQPVKTLDLRRVVYLPPLPENQTLRGSERSGESRERLLHQANKVSNQITHQGGVLLIHIKKLF